MKRDTILIVDDVELNRAILSELFCKDYQVLEAEDGLQALQVIEKNNSLLSVILLDILMPELDGFGVLEWMHDKNYLENQIPVIMITAENSEQTALRSYELGVSDIINKPFSPSIVRRRVENVIALHEYRSRLEHIVAVQKATMDRQAKKLHRMGLKNLFQHPAPCDSEEILSLESICTPAPLKEHSTISRRVLWLLELEREKYRLLSEMTGDIVFSYDLESDLLEFTERFEAVFGGGTRYRSFLMNLLRSCIIYPEDRKHLLRTLRRLKQSPRRDVIRVRMITLEKKVEWYEAYVQPLVNQESGDCVGYIGKLVNINDIKCEADRWKEEAYHDGLTQLYNRKAVEEMALALLHANLESAEQSILFFVDIDNFKQLNDRYGHRFGDKILKYVGCEMRSKFRTTDIVGRIGGDEFVVLINGVHEQSDIERKAEELCSIFHDAICDEAVSLSISGSIGIARYPQDAAEYEDLLHKADLALYHAKRMGKNCYAFYTEDL